MANLLGGLRLDETFTRTITGGTETILADALKSVVALSDGSGTVQTEYTYGPFGSITASETSSSSSLQFTGRDYDDTSLYYYRARYYKPEVGRFITEDPIEFAGG